MGIVYRRQDGKKGLEARSIDTVIVDLGSAVTTIGGYDAKRLGIRYSKLKFSGFSNVGGSKLLRTNRMKNVMLVFRKTNGEWRYEFLDELEILAREKGMSKDDHIPTLLGTDVLRKYTLKPRLHQCTLER